MALSVSSRQSTTNSEEYGLRIDNINVYHLYKKVHDVSLLLTQFPHIHLLGLSETRLGSSLFLETIFGVAPLWRFAYQTEISDS